MIFFLVFILAIILIFTSVGRIAMLASNVEFRDNYSMSILLGFLCSTSLLAWLSLLFPLPSSLWILAILMVISLSISWYLNRRGIGLLRIPKKESKLILSGITLVVLIGGAAKITYNDTLIYHTQAIQWIQEYSVVPGLGNLHTRFAFNSHFFLPSAVFSYTIKEAIMYPLNAVLILALCMYLTHLLKDAVKQKNAKALIRHIVSMSLIVMLYSFWLHTPSPDIALSLLTIFAITYFLEQNDRFSNTSVLVLSFVILTAITIKLSALFLFMLPLYALWNRQQNQEESNRKLVMRIGVIMGIVLLPYIIRNLVLSGYIVYPSSAIDIFNVDWKIPEAIVQYDRDYIEAWAKIPMSPVYEVLEMDFFTWFKEWVIKKSWPFKILILGTLTTIPTLFLAIRNKNQSIVAVIITLWVNLIFWFLTAPDPRFVHGLLIMAFAIGISFLLKQIPIPQRFLRLKIWTVYFLFVSIASITLVKDDIGELAYKHWLIPKSYPTGEMRVVNTNNLEYLVPVVDNQCYNAPIPCAEKEMKNIEMRGTSFAEGFKPAKTKTDR